MTGTVEQIAKYLFKLDKEKKYEIKEYKEKRSLDANGYFWALCNEIGNVLKLGKDEIHDKMLQDYGQVASAILPANANIEGYTKYYKLVRTFKMNDKIFKEYRLFKGSSEMNSKEMAILIDGVRNEAIDLNIEVRTKEEIASLIENWR